MPEGERGEPDQKELKALAMGLIDEQSTVTLATCRENVAWAAPVYYVFLKSAFYFFFGSCIAAHRRNPGKWSGFRSDPWVCFRLAGDSGHSDDRRHRGTLHGV